MIRFMKHYEKIVEEYPDREAFVDSYERIDYKELDNRASRIYAYLKKEGFSTGDMIMILMPKTVNAVAAMLGVIKCGAAYIMIEDTYPEDRVAYIKKDASVKLALTDALIKKIYVEYEALPGYEETDVHDALLAIYTSGSTGNPKGILHEYGKLDIMIENNYEAEDSIFGMIAPMYFIAAQVLISVHLAKASSIHLIEEGLVRDFVRLKQYIYDEKLTKIYLPPSYIRMYTEPSPYLCEILTGSEPANGLYYPGGKPRIFNIYSMSEGGFYVLTTYLDKKYDVAPVGKPFINNLQYMLLDEDGKEVEGEGQGELCFENKYTRGYINLPEKTGDVFTDGMYHTRDIAKRDRDGNYYIVGRLDDMIKISGNRIEPAEIEAKVQDITGLKKVIAKGFDTGSRAFICVYYIRSEAEKLGINHEDSLDIDIERLKTLLPEYMIPSYYIPMDEFPLNANKKIAKKLLPMPDVADYMADYVPPENEKEEYLCELFAKVLELPRVGRNDDFFLLGGDSMKAIQCVSQSDKYEFTVAQLREDSTPAKLGAICAKRMYKDDHEKKNVNGSRQENISGLPFVGALKANVTADTTITMAEAVDVQLLEKAWNRVLSKFDFFRQRLVSEDGKLYYEWNDDDVKVSEIGEVKGIIDRPAVFVQEKTIQVRIPHAYTDGFGMMVFEQTLLREYMALKSGIAQEPEDQGYVEEHHYEMFSEDYSEYGKSIPDVYQSMGEVFRFTQTDKNKKVIYDYTTNPDKMNKLSDKLLSGHRELYENEFDEIGGVLSVVIAELIARAIKNVNSDNSLSIACRCPVNMRKMLGRYGSLTNMSLCQATFRVHGEEGSTLENTLTKVRSATEPDVLKWQLSVIADILKGGDPGDKNRDTLNFLRNPSFLLSNVISGSKTELPEEILSIESANYSDIPMSIYVNDFGEKVRIRFIQQFEDDRYFSEFSRLCEEV